MDTIHQFALAHRRSVAAVLTGLAVLATVTALRQTPEGRTIVVARHDLRSGHVVTSDDLRTSTMPPQAVPRHVLDREAALGRRVAGPMRAGEALTDYRVLRSDSLEGYDRGAVFTTIRVDRADGASGVHVGDRVDVVAVDPDGESDAEVVARGVEIVTVPSGDDAESSSLGVVTSEENALQLATASLSARFSVITSSKPSQESARR
ncbi:MAG: hypothetical protein JWP31_1785 [Aeromicrobium sp.]|nr:hypothetical protein [Aeromicrobium sp.]